MEAQKQFTGLQKALRAIGGPDCVGTLAGVADVNRKTVLNWLREDGTTLGATLPKVTNKVTEAAEKAGGVPHLARALGVTSAAVREWVKLGFVPQKRAQEIELQYGIPRTELVSPRVRSMMGIGGDL